LQIFGELHGKGSRGLAALESKERHRHPPTAIDLANHIADRTTRVVKENLVELRLASQRPKWADSDASLMERAEQEAQAPMTVRTTICAAENENMIR
jgi:hypothetical protein